MYWQDEKCFYAGHVAGFGKPRHGRATAAHAANGRGLAASVALNLGLILRP